MSDAIKVSEEIIADCRNCSEVYVESETELLWKNVSIDVRLQDEGFLAKICHKILRTASNEVVVRRVLNEVSGYARTGNMIAIMGPSGAGKTTLLAALAKKIQLSSGSVKVNGRTVSKQIMSRVSSYISQHDALPPLLTAREYMTFTCALKLGQCNAGKQRDFWIKNVLTEMGLFDTQHTVISNLSGGQRKLLSLATETVVKRKILFIDEPTTGLDTFAAQRVIESLKSITAHGTIILCTIHQPAMIIYEMFSHVMFMTDGRTAYFGTLDNARTFFHELGFNCPVGFDEAEYYVTLLSGRDAMPQAMNLKAVSPLLITNTCEICQVFSTSRFSVLSISTKTKGIFVENPPTRKNWFKQVYWILWRIITQSRRSNFQECVLWLSYAISIISIGLFYMNTNSYTQKGIQDVRGIIFMIISEIEFNIAYTIVYEFPSEILLYLNEESVYSANAYYVATVLGVIPRILVKSIVFAIVLYTLLNTGLHLVVLFLFCFCTVLTSVCGISYGFMISGWIENYNVATTIMIPFDILFLLTGGVYYNIRSLPTYLSYFKYLSIFYYSNEAYSIIHWSRVDKIDCTVDDKTCLFTGEEVLAEYGYSATNFYIDIGGLILLIVIMNIIGYLGVRRRRTVKSVY